MIVYDANSESSCHLVRGFPRLFLRFWLGHVACGTGHVLGRWFGEFVRGALRALPLLALSPTAASSLPVWGVDIGDLGSDRPFVVAHAVFRLLAFAEWLAVEPVSDLGALLFLGGFRAGRSWGSNTRAVERVMLTGAVFFAEAPSLSSALVAAFPPGALVFLRRCLDSEVCPQWLL